MSINPSEQHPPKTWERDGYLISTDPGFVSIPALNAAFASEQLYWAQALPEPAMREMINNSLCFGLYTPTPSLPPTQQLLDDPEPAPADTLHEIATSVRPNSNTSQQETAEPTMIGFARAITDYTTFFYLTDVYVLPAWQGQGLGKWLVGCVQEVAESMPHLRRTMCLVGHGETTARDFYKKAMKMDEVAPPMSVLTWRGRGGVI